MERDVAKATINKDTVTLDRESLPTTRSAKA